MVRHIPKYINGDYSWQYLSVDSFGNRQLSSVRSPRDLADVDIGVVRAAFAVAETGSVCLTQYSLVVNSLGYLPQHLIVLLDPADIVVNLQHAYSQAGSCKATTSFFIRVPRRRLISRAFSFTAHRGVRTLSVCALGTGCKIIKSLIQETST
jgi:L-lactate dehydrogenase complex protein LldG